MTTFDLACKYFDMCRIDNMTIAQELEFKNVQYMLWLKLGLV